MFFAFKNILKPLVVRNCVFPPNTKTKICNYSTKAGMETQIEINGQTINYVQRGTGKHTLLCFPGALGTIWSDFKPQIEGLDQKHFTIVAWDPPGYGHSRPPGRKFGTQFYENDADTANDLMQKIGFKQYSVLGWSDGGISGMIMAAKYPEAIRKLVIWGANSYVLPEEIKIYENIRDISKWSDKMKAPLIALYTEKGLQDMWNDWCDALNEIEKQKKGNICKDVLPKIKSPTFIVHGDKDPMLHAGHPDHLLANIKGSRLYRFPEGKHNIHLRYAEEFNDMVTKFLFQ